MRIMLDTTLFSLAKALDASPEDIQSSEPEQAWLAQSGGLASIVCGRMITASQQSPFEAHYG